MMRARHFFFPASVALALLACAHDDHKPVVHPTTPHTAQATPPGPNQYIVGDPGGGSRGTSIVVPLQNGQVGVVVEKARIIAGRGDPRVAADVPEAPITGAEKIPQRFGGGFLFWSDAVLYRADAFDGALKPVVKVPDSVQSVSFASKFLLVRTVAGERWALSIPSGQRVAVDPLGVADVQALDDGRAIAFNDQSAVFTSVDGGEHWTDVTTQLRSAPQKVARIEDEIWLLESSGAAQRLEADGHLAYFDHVPTEKPPEVRTRDPKWRGNEFPLREVFRGGAAIDDGTALVIADGDLVRIDIRTGEVVSTVQGRLPPDARCEAIPTSNDVLFACGSRNYQAGYSGGSAFVVSHTLGDEPPTVEQTFNGLSQFYGSDDGGLAYNGPCAGVGVGAGRPGLVLTGVDTGQRLVEAPGDGHGDADPRQVQDAPHRGRRGDDVHAARQLPGLLVDAQDDVHPGGVHERHLGQVQQEVPPAVVELVGQVVLELGRGVDVQITLHLQQGDVLTGQRHLDGQRVLGNGHVYLHD